MDISLLSLKLADGSPLACYAGIIVPVRIGNVVVKQAVLVANIFDPAILGLDFMRFHGCQIDMTTQEFEVRGQRVPYNQTKNRADQGKVRLDKNCEIEPRCQTIVWTKADETFQFGCLIEANPDFEQRYNLKVASCLAGESVDMIPIRLMNIGLNPVKFYKNTVVAFVEPLQGDPVNLFESTGQVQHDIVNQIHVQPDTSPDCHTQEEELPEYLSDLYAQATIGMEWEQKQVVAQLLKDLKSVFAENSSDLGRTTVAEHEINTGDAVPIKQRPRRTPISFRGEEEKEIQSMLDKGVIKESSSGVVLLYLFERKMAAQDSVLIIAV